VVDAEVFDPSELTWLEVVVDALADPLEEAVVDVEAVDEEACDEESVCTMVFVEALDVPVDGVDLSADAVVFVEALAEPEPGVAVPVDTIVLVELLAELEPGVVVPVEAVEAFVLVDVLAELEPPEDAVVELEVEAVADVAAVAAEVEGLFATVVWVVGVDVDTGVEPTGVDDPDVVVV
jgi:hypothetical protein